MDRNTKKLLGRGYLDTVTNLYYMMPTNIDHDVTNPVVIRMLTQKTHSTLSVLTDTKRCVDLNAHEEQSVPYIIKYFQYQKHGLKPSTEIIMLHVPVLFMQG